MHTKRRFHPDDAGLRKGIIIEAADGKRVDDNTEICKKEDHKRQSNDDY